MAAGIVVFAVIIFVMMMMMMAMVVMVMMMMVLGKVIAILHTSDVVVVVDYAGQRCLVVTETLWTWADDQHNMY